MEQTLRAPPAIASLPLGSTVEVPAKLTLRIGIRQYRRGAQSGVFVARTQTSVSAEECELVHILARLTARQSRRAQADCASPAWQKRPVMSTAKMERTGWRWTSDTIAVVIYSVLVTLLMLSWAYIPA